MAPISDINFFYTIYLILTSHKVFDFYPICCIIVTTAIRYDYY